MVLAVLGLVILDPSFNRPSPHSEHTVEGVGGDTMQWFVIPPSQAWISLFHGMCSLSKTATSLERTRYSCSLHLFFSLTMVGVAHSLERRRPVVLFVILLISYFAGFTSTRCTESLAEKQEEGQKSQASKTTAQEKTC